MTSEEMSHQHGFAHKAQLRESFLCKTSTFCAGAGRRMALPEHQGWFAIERLRLLVFCSASLAAIIALIVQLVVTNADN
jgi:hypothetical protein